MLDLRRLAMPVFSHQVILSERVKRVTKPINRKGSFILGDA